MKKNFILTLFCAILPGFGQMYYGYMKRGVSLTAWFCAVIFLAVILNMGIVTLGLPIIWAFAFFDTFNIRNMDPEQRAAKKDDFLPSMNEEQGWFSARFKKLNPNQVFGWALVIIGILVMYNIVSGWFYWNLWERFPVLARLMNDAVPFILGIVVIVLGVKMLKKQKAAPDAQAPWQDGIEK